MENIKLPTIKRGCAGDAARLLNALMGDFDKDVFDEESKTRLKQIQSESGLKADGIAGENSWMALINRLTDALGGDGEQKTPRSSATGAPLKIFDFKQYDKRWASRAYSSTGNKKQTMKSSGCGPCAAADVVASLKDPDILPTHLADKALARGDRTKNSGTAWSFFSHINKEYGFSKYIKTTSMDELKNCLSQGGLAVASMSKGYWTNGGHYICVWKIEDGYVYAKDPASSKRTKQKENDFKREMKALFCYWG